MPYGNYTLVANNQFRNRSFEDLAKPLQMYTEEYNNVEGALSDLETKANVWEGMANEQTDPIAYAKYKRYADDLQRQASQLAQSGLTPNVKRDLMNLKKRYASEIIPIEEAYANRKVQVEEQRKAMLQNPTLLLSRRADKTSLDEYLNNPQLGYEQYNGALLTQQVGDAASALARSLRSYGNGERLDDYTKTWLQQHGYTAAEVAQAINNPDSPRSNQILTSIVNNVMSDSGIPQWADRATMRQAYDYASQGLWKAIGETKVTPYTDEDAVIRGKEESEKRMLQYKAGLAQMQQLTDIAINPVNVYSQKERTEAANNMKDFAKFFDRDKNGNYVLNDRGIREYNMFKSGTDPRYIEISRQKGEPNPMYSDFKDFVDKMGWQNYLKAGDVNKLGKLWADYINENQDDAYDATKITEFDYQLDSSKQDEFKQSLQAALMGIDDIPEVDFDAKSHTFKPTGKSLKIEDLNSDKVKIISTRFSPYGTNKNELGTVLIKGEDGLTHRYALPNGINPTNEKARDKALFNVYVLQNKLNEYAQNGYYTDAGGNRVYPSDAKIQEMNAAYKQNLQRAYLYHSQIGLTNKTKEQEFNPFGF